MHKVSVEERSDTSDQSKRKNVEKIKKSVTVPHEKNNVYQKKIRPSQRETQRQALLNVWRKKSQQ